MCQSGGTGIASIPDSHSLLGPESLGALFGYGLPITGIVPYSTITFV
jgi:hypothetical protein